MKDKIITFIKALIIGSTMLVPGVSGGSMAMILGIYDRLISSVSSFFKDKKRNLLFLFIFCIGSIGGMIAFAQPILTAINRWEQPMLYFFIGLVVGGIPLMLKKAQLKSFSWKSILLIILGAVLVLLLAQLPSYDFDGGGLMGMLLLIVAGFISAIALVLPGISVSYMLLLLGMYDTTMQSIATLYLPFLIPLAIGGILGILSTTKLLEYLMNRFPQPTYLIIIGFVAGSVFEIIPGIPLGFELLICLAALAVGVLLITALLRLDKE